MTNVVKLLLQNQYFSFFKWTTKQKYELLLKKVSINSQKENMHNRIKTWRIQIMCGRRGNS